MKTTQYQITFKIPHATGKINERDLAFIADSIVTILADNHILVVGNVEFKEVKEK